ncbi:MAG: hypothetical protein QM770_22370 [Tepidisphaeraceae bacterium]
MDVPSDQADIARASVLQAQRLLGRIDADRKELLGAKHTDGVARIDALRDAIDNVRRLIESEPAKEPSR